MTTGMHSKHSTQWPGHKSCLLLERKETRRDERRGEESRRIVFSNWVKQFLHSGKYKVLKSAYGCNMCSLGHSDSRTVGQSDIHSTCTLHIHSWAELWSEWVWAGDGFGLVWFGLVYLSVCPSGLSRFINETLWLTRIKSQPGPRAESLARTTKDSVTNRATTLTLR